MTWKMLYRWPMRQTRAWFMHFFAFLMGTVNNPNSILPPAVWSTWEWLKQQLPRSFGFSSPDEQVTASITLVVVSFLTGFVTGGAAWFLIFVFLFTGWIGLLRFFPAKNKLWVRYHPGHGR